MPLKTMIFGGGDLASGVALRLFRAGCQVIVTELPQPYAVRRTVSFAQAVFDSQIVIENVTGKAFSTFPEVPGDFSGKIIPVLIDPDGVSVTKFHPDVLIDARMTKKPNSNGFFPGIFTIGLGPGFNVGENCNAVVETKRGHFLGRAYYSGTAEADTGIPDRVANFQKERVLRAPADGVFETKAEIGQVFEEKEEIGRVGSELIKASFRGMLRGLLHNGLLVQEGVKVGDIDPRIDAELCQLVSDKALAVGGGVIEIILSKPDFRRKLD
jgi:xanthine dehydrogenase accessory factor